MGRNSARGVDVVEGTARAPITVTCTITGLLSAGQRTFRSDENSNAAQIATLTSELAGDPDDAIVKQALHTLRNITEGAIGSLVAAAGQPAIWRWLHQFYQSL